MNTLKELYLEAARVSEMIEGTELSMLDVVRYNGHPIRIPHYFNTGASYEFCLAIVESRPVFKGDVLYDHNPAHKESPMFTADNIHSKYMSSTVSWLPPKPKTVMVELLVDDAQQLTNRCVAIERVNNACRKALEGLKS